MGFEEQGYVIEKIEGVLEKFDGDEGDPNRVLRERMTLVDGVLTKHEWFDTDGNLTKVEEGGN